MNKLINIWGLKSESILLSTHSFIKKNNHNKISIILSSTISLIAIQYMVGVLLNSPNPTDLKYFWIAGKLWLEGANVYDESFTQLALSVAATTTEIENQQWFAPFLYAPHIWTLCVLLGLFEYETARVVLGTIQILCIFFGTLLAMHFVPKPRIHVYFSLLLLLASTTLGTAMSISMAQFGPFIYLGIAAFFFGACRNSRWALIFGLILLTLKPNIGLPAIAFALFANHTSRVSLFTAGTLALIMAAPALLPNSILDVLESYINSINRYSSYGPNTAQSTTGFINFFYESFGTNPRSIIFVGLAMLFASLLGWFSKSFIETNNISPQFLMAVMLLIIICFVPLHLYDLTILVLFFVLLEGPVGLIIAGFSNLIIFRVHRLSEILGISSEIVSFRGSFLTSIVFALIFIYLSLQLMRRIRKY